MKKYIVFLLLLAPFISYSQTIPKAKKGVIDISQWYFVKKGNISLSGQWEFYWHKFLTPDDFKDSTYTPDAYINVPGSWTKIKIDGKEIPDTGYATYRLILKSDKDFHLPMKIFIKEILTSYRLFYNGKLLTETGIPAKSSSEYVPQVRLNKISINIHKGNNELIVQIANFNHRSNGFVQAPEIGEQNRMDLTIFKTLAIDVFVLGILLIMALYHFGVYIYIKSKSALFFAIFSLTLSLRILVTGNFLFTILFPQASWNFVYRLSYFSLYSSFPLFALYFKYTFNENNQKIFFNSIFVISFIFLLSIFLPSIFYTKIVVYYQIFMILTIFYYFYLLIKYIKNKVAGAKTLLIFIIIIALATINDILYTNEIIHTGEMIGYGLFFFILGQALTIAKVFANAYRENKILLKKLDSHNIILERAVKERTKELSANRNELEKQNNKLKTVIEKLDITNEELQKKNEELLKYFQIINQSPISIVITDIDQNIVYVNPFFEKITGYSKAEVLGKNPKVLNSGKTPPERYKEMYEKLEKGQSWTGEFINKRKNGVIFIEKAIISIIYDSEGNPVNYLGLKEDITELKHKEEEIREKTIMLENLNNELNKALSDLMAGLNYAQRIQRAFLSSEDYIKTMFDEYLLIFKPKEAVGGDAYYFKKLDNLKIIAIIDCTGHGVPGGFLSMMAISLLNNYSSDLTKETPAEILEKIREQVKINLGNNNEKVQDGFDIGLATFNTKNNELLYAGANISAYIVRGNELYTLNSVRNPIGNYPLEKNFENRNLKIRKEDIMYLSTDGYVDQFGEKGKYTNKRFKKFILEHSNLHLKQQKILFEKEFLEWKGNQTQVDDITVIAIKFLH